MSLPFPARVKYINMKNQKRERIFASRISDRQLIEVTPPREPKSVLDKSSSGLDSAS